MWNVKAKVIPVKTGATGAISKLDNTSATYQESRKLRKCKKQPYWALHTKCGKF